MFGVYRLLEFTGAFQAKLKQGQFSLPESACVSHDAAAMLHELDGVLSARVHFIAPRGLEARRGIKLHRTREPLSADEVARVKGFAVTSVKRTLLDLAQECSYLKVLMAMDCALRRNLVTIEELRRYLESKRRSRHRGKGKFERALDDCDARGRPFRSALEVRWWVVSIAAGLPVPLIEPQMSDDVGVLFPDFFYPWIGAVIETKGRKDHASPKALERDARRELRLACLGYPVISITWGMLQQNTPRVIARVREAFEALATHPREWPPRGRWFRKAARQRVEIRGGVAKPISGGASAAPPAREPRRAGVPAR